MKIIVWHKTNHYKEDEIKVYYIGDKTDKEMQDALRVLWEKEINKPEYDIDEHLEDTFFEETRAHVADYDYFIDMYIDEAKTDVLVQQCQTQSIERNKKCYQQIIRKT